MSAAGGRARDADREDPHRAECERGPHPGRRRHRDERVPGDGAEHRGDNHQYATEHFSENAYRAEAGLAHRDTYTPRRKTAVEPKKAARKRKS